MSTTARRYGLTPLALYMNCEFQDAGETHVAYRGSTKDLFDTSDYVRKYTTMIPPTLIHTMNRTQRQVNVVVIDDIHGTLSKMLREQLVFLRHRRNLRIYSIIPSTHDTLEGFTVPFFKIDDTPGITNESSKLVYMSKVVTAKASIDIFAYSCGLYDHNRQFDTVQDDFIALIGNFIRGTKLFVDIIVRGDRSSDSFGKFLISTCDVLRNDIAPMSVIKKVFDINTNGEYRLFQVFVFRKKQSNRINKVQ